MRVEFITKAEHEGEMNRVEEIWSAHHIRVTADYVYIERNDGYKARFSLTDVKARLHEIEIED